MRLKDIKVGQRYIYKDVLGNEFVIKILVKHIDNSTNTSSLYVSDFIKFKMIETDIRGLLNSVHTKDLSIKGRIIRKVKNKVRKLG